MAKRKPLKHKSKSSQSRKKKRTFKQIILKFAFSLALLLALFCALLVVSVWSGIFAHLPQVEELRQIKHKSASLLYASDGSLIGKYYTENRQTIDNEHISIHVRHALIATEDNRFFEHRGFDVISLGRVFVKTILLGDTSQGGGSTISQQLAKNLYPRRSFKILSLPLNKIREIFIASRLEKAYTKDDILGLYLNTVPFGEDVYGIEAAARRYFNQTAADLSIAESATLIGMLAANTAYSPRLHPERSMQRRNVVISRMVVQGFVPEEMAERIKADSIQLDYTLMSVNQGVAPYFRAQLYNEVKTILENNFEDKYNIESDGLRIYTTINAKLQNYAEKAVKQHMHYLQEQFDHHWEGRDPLAGHPDIFKKALEQTRPYQNLKEQGTSDKELNKRLLQKHQTTIFTHDGEKNVSMSTIDSLKHYLKLLNTGFLAVNPQNGAILSWIGGVNHKYLPYDHVMSKRQVGSTFKPIVYTTALMNGSEPCDIFSNERRVYEAYDNWSPANSEGEYQGYYSFKGALAHSVNTVTAELIMKTGIESVIETARMMGITSPIPEAPSIALGTPSISLFEMVMAYTSFANYGRPVEPFGLLRIEDSDGTILYERRNNESLPAAFDEETAMYMNAILQGVIDRGTGRGLRNTYGLKFDMGGKTGTTQNNADGWFMGYTPKLVAGVWVGAEQPAVHFRTTTLGQGAHMALPIFGLTMQKVVADPALKHLTNVPFRLLSPRMARKMDCADYYDEKPEKGIINILLNLFNDKDSLDQQQLKETPQKPADEKKKKRGFLKKLRDIFINQ